MHSHWRDCKEWENIGLPLSTTNNEVAKLYDAALTQLLSYRDEPSVGGLVDTLGNMQRTDPEFVLGHVLVNGLGMIGSDNVLRRDPELQKNINTMKELSERAGVPRREYMHAQAVVHWANCLPRKAAEVYDEILLEYPLDALALQFGQFSYLLGGNKPRHRDLVSKVLPYWTPALPHYGYVHGIHAFALVENNYFERAEYAAKKALEHNRVDPWTCHTMAHVHGTQGRVEEGQKFMSCTESDWQGSGLAQHNYWHWALLDIEQAQYESALAHYDTHIHPGVVKDKNMSSIIDGTSLLERLQLEGVNVGDRWEDLYEIARPRIDDHCLTFNDAHILLACLGSGHNDAAKQIIDSAQEFVRECVGDHRDFLASYGCDVMRGISACCEGDYSLAVDLIYPHRYKLITMGGSIAQVDVFNLILIHSAINSRTDKHQKIARQLLAERSELRPDSPMTQRLLTRVLAQHT